MAEAYQIIRSDRKTVAIQIMPDGNVIVRCPKRMKTSDIRKFVESKSGWIAKHLANRIPQKTSKLTAQEVHQLREQTRELVTQRARYFAPLIGVTFQRITVRSQRTRWGSCSAQGNLNFNCLLALVPAEVLDYVVVHELCHRLELNHGSRFWQEVERILPDYQTYRNWLKENGSALIAKL